MIYFDDAVINPVDISHVEKANLANGLWELPDQVVVHFLSGAEPLWLGGVSMEEFQKKLKEDLES